MGTTAVAFGIVVAAMVAITGLVTLWNPSRSNAGLDSKAVSSVTDSTSPYPLAVYEETCSFAYGPAPVNYYLGSRCVAGQPVGMPTTYSLAAVSQGQSGNTTTLYEAYFAFFLASGQTATVSISSGAPLYINVFFDNRTSIDTGVLANETPHGAHPLESTGGVRASSDCLPDGELSGQGEWYVYQILGGSLGHPATVTFNIQPDTPCPTTVPQGMNQ